MPCFVKQFLSLGGFGVPISCAGDLNREPFYRLLMHESDRFTYLDFAASALLVLNVSKRDLFRMISDAEVKIQSLEKMADIFPYLVLSVYIAGCTFCVVIGRMDYLITGSLLAVPAIIGSFVLVLIKRSGLELSESEQVFPCNGPRSILVFALFYTLTILVLVATPIDSRWSLLMVLILYVTIFVQILSARLLPAVVILEVVLTLAATIYGYTLRSGLYFGTTDILPHMYMSTITYLSGHVIPEELGTYAYFPLYHIFVALSSHLLHLDIQTSLFVTTGLIYAVSVLFLYCLTRSVLHNEQLSLLIVLVYAMNSSVVYYGTYVVTRTMAYIGLLILLYLLYSVANPVTATGHACSRPAAPRFLAIIVIVFILLVHQISTPMIVGLLGLLFLFGLFVRDRGRVNLLFLMVSITLLATYWTFVADSFIEELFPRTDPSLYKNIVFAPVVHQGLSFVVGQIDTLIIVFFALIGGVYLVWAQKPRSVIVFGLFGLISVILNVPNVLTMVFQLVTILRIDRFALLFLPFLAIVMGVGIYAFTRYLSVAKVPAKLAKTLLVVLIALYGIGSLGFTDDEPGYNRYFFNQDEVTGFDHVLEAVPSGSSLHSDYYTWRFFTRERIEQSEDLKLPYYTNFWLQSDLEIPEKEGYIVFPNRYFRHGGLLLEKGGEFDPEGLQPYLPTEENIRIIMGKLSIEDKIYSNYGVDVYMLSPSPTEPEEA